MGLLQKICLQDKSDFEAFLTPGPEGSDFRERPEVCSEKAMFILNQDAFDAESQRKE